ncbi:MAG: hypothetical protein U0Y82_16945, partial [Thermoleophilia bacterium]
TRRKVPAMQQLEHPLAQAHLLDALEAEAFCGECLHRFLELHEQLCGGRDEGSSTTVPLAREVVAAQHWAEAGHPGNTSGACLRGIQEVALQAALQRGFRRHAAHRVASDAVRAEMEWQRDRIADLVRRGA